MMIKLTVLYVLLPYICFSQQIKFNEVDGFTKQRTIETSIVSIKTAYTDGMGISLGAAGNHYLINIVGYGKGTGEATKADKVYLLMEDGLVITATSIGEQPANESSFTKVYQHRYLIRLKDLQDISVKRVMLLRITTASGNVDVTVSKKGAKDIKKLAEILLKELAKTRQNN